MEIGVPRYHIPQNITDEGYRIGLIVQGFVNSSDFAGTLKDQYGACIRTGVSRTLATGRINNSYALYLDNLSSSSVTIDNAWGVYQASTKAKNYFGGNVGIGSKYPAYKLDVDGTIRGINVSPSDVRWKTKVTSLENSLDKVSALRGVRYEWKDASKGTGDQIGLIAQEVETVFPEVVSTDKDGYKSVSYGKLVSPLIQAVKELKQENEGLKKEVSELKQLVQTLIKENSKS